MVKKYRKALFIVVYRRELKENKIYYLLLKRKLHWKGWEFPKGGIKDKESAIKTIKREIKEETGQSPKNILKYPVSGKYKYKNLLVDRPLIVGQEYKLYSAEIFNKKIIVDKVEHSGFKWLTFEKAMKKLTWDNQKKCLKVVKKKLEKLKK